MHPFLATKISAAGTRTRVARVRAEYPNQLDYSGGDSSCYFCASIHEACVNEFQLQPQNDFTVTLPNPGTGCLV